MNNNINNSQPMNTMSNSKWRKIVSSAFHFFIYVAILTLMSTSLVSGQLSPCDGISLACNNGINISTNENCFAEVTLDIIMEGYPAGFSDEDFVITLKTSADSIYQFSDDSFATANGDGVITVGDEEVGTTFKACATLVQCGITCWGNVTIEDKVGPKFLNCNGNAEFGIEPVEIPCNDGFNLSNPPLAMTCDTTTTDITFSDENLGVTCVGLYSGEIVRSWFATDAAGNQTVCKQQLFVTKFDVNDVVFPDNFLFEIDAEDCDNIPSIEPSNTGEPTGLECPNIMFFYTDIGTETCGQQIKLIRDWFVVDWCSGESVSDGQVIKVVDNSPPVSSCPIDREIRGSRFVTRTTAGSAYDTLYVPSFSQSCSALVTLDPFAIVDSLTAPVFVSDCSLPLSIQVSYKTAEPGVDPNTVPFNNISQGADGLFPIPEIIDDVTWVRYCFTDACGNGDMLQEDPNDPDLLVGSFVNCCLFEIRVSDNNPPNAICEGFTKVPVGAGGTTSVPAFTFDDHSFDPCGSVMTYEVRRENPGCGTDNFYGPTVDFCCADIGDTLTVFLKVTDSEGNFSECPTRVCVTDDFVPQFDCPDDVTLDCIDDYEALATASGTVGCSSTYTIDNGFFDLSQFNLSCNTGIITRKIYVKDLNGVTIDSCQQRITVRPMGDSANLTPGDYVFPDDVMIDQCGNNTSIHPDQTGYPTTTEDYQCINIGISYEDGPLVQSNNDGVCYTILRKWTVVDWCRYETNNPDQFSLTGTQTLIINNSGAPVLDCPDMLMVSTDSIDCIGFINLDPVLTDNCVGSRISWALDADADGTVNATGTGSASGEYPVGDYSLTYNVTNECGGGSTSCTFPFSIKGNRPPLPICLATITWTLNEDGEAVVWANDFDLKSEGGCDGMDSLTFSFVSPDNGTFPQSSMTFDCSDLPNGASAMISLQIFIIDESGTFEACTVILDLQDTNDVCPDVGSITTLAGSVMTEKAHAMENVMVQLDDMTNVNSTMEMTTSAGSYAFNSVDYYNAYSIHPEHDIDHLNGISTLDLIQIQRHILGIDELDTPYKVIAADINKDNQVDGIDLVELRKLILGIYTELPQNDSWVFVSEGYGFSDPMQPWGYDNSIDIQSLYSANNNADFIAVKVGDVNTDAVVSAESDEISNRNAPFYFSGDNASFKKGDLVAVPFRAEDSATLTGLQLTMKFDPRALLFQGIDKGIINLTEANFALLNEPFGTLTFSYSDINGFELENGEELFTIYFEAQQDGNLTDLIDLTDDVAKSEVYYGHSGSSVMEYVMREEVVAQGQELELFQNQPNPFSESTRISFYTPAEQEIFLKVFDSTGRMILSRQDQFEKGMNEFNIESDELSSHGILIYQIETDDASLTNKMILVR